jgi:hypothetical protein
MRLGSFGRPRATALPDRSRINVQHEWSGFGLSHPPHNFDCETDDPPPSLMFLIRVKALASATPSDVDKNSADWRGPSGLSLASRGAGAPGCLHACRWDSACRPSCAWWSSYLYLGGVARLVGPSPEYENPTETRGKSQGDVQGAPYCGRPSTTKLRNFANLSRV